MGKQKLHFLAKISSQIESKQVLTSSCNCQAEFKFLSSHEIDEVVVALDINQG